MISLVCWRPALHSGHLITMRQPQPSSTSCMGQGRSAGHLGLCQGLSCFWEMLTFGPHKRQPFEPGLLPYPQE